MIDNATPIRVLDHGFVRLVDHMGDDLSIVRAARVSYDAEWRAGENEGSDARLIGYLMRNKHVSPFEAVEFQFEVKAPIFILRQWYRHRTWSPNEVSGRYVDLGEPEFYIPEAKNIGVQSKDNKQGRDTTKQAFGVRVGMIQIRDTCLLARETYQTLLVDGWPRELARMVLPLNTYTRCFLKADLRAVLSFLEQRLDPHAQWEIQQYAKAILESVRPVVPEAIRAWEAGNVRKSA